jgi:hypothetical protein
MARLVAEKGAVMTAEPMVLLQAYDDFDPGARR